MLGKTAIIDGKLYEICVSELCERPEIYNATLKLIGTEQQVLQAEIDYCEENKGSSGKPEDFENGFIQGIRQSAHILKRRLKD